MKWINTSLSLLVAFLVTITTNNLLTKVDRALFDDAEAYYNAANKDKVADIKAIEWKRAPVTPPVTPPTPPVTPPVPPAPGPVRPPQKAPRWQDFVRDYGEDFQKLNKKTEDNLKEDYFIRYGVYPEIPERPKPTPTPTPTPPKPTPTPTPAPVPPVTPPAPIPPVGPPGGPPVPTAPPVSPSEKPPIWDDFVRDNIKKGDDPQKVPSKVIADLKVAYKATYGVDPEIPEPPKPVTPPRPTPTPAPRPVRPPDTDKPPRWNDWVMDHGLDPQKISAEDKATLIEDYVVRFGELPVIPVAPPAPRPTPTPAPTPPTPAPTPPTPAPAPAPAPVPPVKKAKVIKNAGEYFLSQGGNPENWKKPTTRDRWEAAFQRDIVAPAKAYFDSMGGEAKNWPRADTQARWIVAYQKAVLGRVD